MSVTEMNLWQKFYGKQEIHRILNSQVYLELVIHYTKTIRAIMDQQQHMDGSVYIIMIIILTMCLKVDNLRCGLALAHVIR